ncbi:MAG: aspartate aminotransferase family protein [Candidatus Eremiobacteraeota bacterium]|nr:aspartate aminotransferase family protein [Candidatus Eremiobacteraeota bacterium]MBC5827557.1 aspartate aminotransferase family protein [Candidatus Eremiobacteraeota bacterium]
MIARSGDIQPSLFDDVYASYKDFVNPPLARFMKLAGAPVEMRASGCRIWDEAGRSYLDFCGGYGVFTLGHMHPVVVDAVRAQLETMALSSRVFFNEKMGALAAALAKLAPGNLQITFFSNSGTEAVEAALKLARLSTKRTKIVSTQNAYHGKTMGSLTATGRDVFKDSFEPLIPQFEHVVFGDLEALDRALLDAAAFIVEPVQCEGGVIIPPDGYLRGVRDLCDAHGALLIADEVQTGLGRTGYVWGVDYESVVPDIMTVAKGLSGGVVPIGATISKLDVWMRAFGKSPLMHTSTFGGNPLACSAGLAAIKVLRDENLVQRSRMLGDYLLAKARELQAKVPDVIEHARGRGLVVGIELTSEGYGGVIIPECLKLGMTAAYTLNQQKVIRLEPPLIVTQEEIDEAMDIFAQGVTKAKEKLGRLAVR